MTIENPPSPLKLLLLACALLLCLPTGLRAELPTLGDPTLQHFNSKQETILGKAFYTSLRENLNFVDDPQVNHYLQSLAARLASHSDAAGGHFRFFIIDSKVINAFAGPHGHIGINSGLILESENESQLASVIAHEISHVTQRHIARAYSESGSHSAASFAGLLAAILISTQDPVAGQAALLSGIAGAQQSSINFTRHNEYEADRIGIELLTDAGINPRGMVEFFELLLARGDGLNIEYLRTHPLSINRVTEARNRVAKKHSKLPADSIDFQLCKARLEVLSDDAAGRYADSTPTDDIERYRKAIALIKVQQNRQATQILEKLVVENKHPWIKLALAESLGSQQDLSRATQILKELSRFYPDYIPVTLAYAKNLIQTRQAQDAISILIRQLQSDDSTVLHKTLAQAYFLNGQISAALESTGNQYQREGYTELAIQQYENALQQPQINASRKQRLLTKIEILSSDRE